MKRSGHSPLVILLAAGVWTAAAFALQTHWLAGAFAAHTRSLEPIIWAHLSGWLIAAPGLYALSARGAYRKAAARAALLAAALTALPTLGGLLVARGFDRLSIPLFLGAGVVLGCVVLGAVGRAPVLARTHGWSAAHAVVRSLRQTRAIDWWPTPSTAFRYSGSGSTLVAHALVAPLILIGHLWALLPLALVARDGSTARTAFRSSARIVGAAGGLYLALSIAVFAARLGIGALIDAYMERGFGPTFTTFTELVIGLGFCVLVAAAIRALLARLDPPVPDVFD